jgi:ClpP class serine protease
VRGSAEWTRIHCCHVVLGAPRVQYCASMFDPWNAIWIFFILSSLQPLIQKQLLALGRRRALADIAAQRDATVITLIHRQETISLLGIPLMRHIDIDDAESVLRAIRGTPPGRTIEIILHTPGGLVLAASQIARALRDHDGRIVAVIPHYAMSGGTLIALAADEIVLDRHAALGPVDPQLGQYPAASLVEVAAMPGRHDDQTLILADIGRKALGQVEAVVRELLERHFEPERARQVAQLFASGVWTHDHPLMARELEQLGLPVRVGVPDEERALMDLYPQPRGRQTAVEYVPGRPLPPGLPPGREAPRRRREAKAPARAAATSEDHRQDDRS